MTLDRKANDLVTQYMIRRLREEFPDDASKEKAIKQLREYTLLSPSETTALIFCEILYYLIKKGKIIPHFDIMIAALAIEHDLTLITADRDFENIARLKKVILSV